MADERKGIAGALSEQLKGVTRGTIESLALKMGVLPSERAWVAVDIGASLAGISLKATVEFFRAAPEVARLLDNDDVRAFNGYLDEARQQGQRVPKSVVMAPGEVLKI